MVKRFFEFQDNIKEIAVTVSQALKKGTDILKNANNEAPALEAGVIFCHITGKDKTFLYSHGGDNLAAESEKAFIDAIGRRAEGVPLQHITGFQEFMSLNFRVGPEVLIPRQDTETLVEAVIAHVKAADKKETRGPAEGGPCSVRILDIGTGSGCIAISLAHYLEGCCVTAVDVSPAALELARANAADHKAGDKVKFVLSDLFSRLEKSESFDVIVSNPPYIPAMDIDNLQIEVKAHEPVLALDGGRDGMDYYRRITAQGVQYLNPGGLLAFEVGYGQAEAVRNIMESSFGRISVYKDLSGVERVVAGYLK